MLNGFAVTKTQLSWLHSKEFSSMSLDLITALMIINFIVDALRLAIALRHMTRIDLD